MLITMPASPVAATIDWSLDQPGESNRSEVTGKRRVTLLPAAPRWYRWPAVVRHRAQRSGDRRDR
jgi:hypothetical protein